MSSAIFIKELQKQFQRLRPTTVTRHGEKKIFVFKDLATASHVFVRYDGPKQPLQLPYTGPYPVISRSDKSFVVNIAGKNSTITIDRLKPAYMMSSDIEEPELEEPDDEIVIALPRRGCPRAPTTQPEAPAATRTSGTGRRGNHRTPTAWTPQEVRGPTRASTSTRSPTSSRASNSSTT
ncbi:GSCOCG00011768001-RA-CDS, partial [Cotesia congregata]